jgi:hypothetical protein
MEQFREMIQEDFEILMVHSAFEQLQPMYSGAVSELVAELMAFCGPNRTLAMPAFILGAPKYDPIKYYRTHKFDVRRSISEMGLATEVFRRKPGVKRSLHPTHSVCALGPLADELTATHHLGTALGKNSPFEVMARKRTVVIGIGVEYYRSLTQAKSAIELMGDDFPVESVKETVNVRMIDASGAENSYPLTVKTFNRSFRGIILRSLMSPSELMERRFHGVPLWKTSAPRVMECLSEAMSRGITLFGRVPMPARFPTQSFHE